MARLIVSGHGQPRIHAIEQTRYRDGADIGQGKVRPAMNASDTARVQGYLRQRFGNKRLSLARRENKDDSADLMLEDEFIGVVFQDDEDGEVCFHVQISILAEDLDDM
jgi:hypothetical protein